MDQYEDIYEYVVDKLIEDHKMDVSWGPPCIKHMRQSAKKFNPKAKDARPRAYFMVVGKYWFLCTLKMKAKIPAG